MKEGIKENILEIKEQYIPDSQMDFLPKSSVENSLNLEIPDTVSKMIVENGKSFYLISKIEDNLFVKITANKSNNNIGILKTTLKKITDITE